MLIGELRYVDYIMIISNAKVNRARPKPETHCVLNAFRIRGSQVTGLLTYGQPNDKSLSLWGEYCC